MSSGATPGTGIEGGVEMISVLSVAVLASALVAPPPFFASSPAVSAPAQCSAAPVAQAQKPKLPNGITTKSTCSADCGPLNAPVSCTGSTCSARNQDVSCPSAPGQVICDGIVYVCAPCCTDGAIRNVTTGPTCGCDDGKTTPKDRYQCVDGVWEYQFSFCGGPFCQG
jgi:hypothetical protein